MESKRGLSPRSTGLGRSSTRRWSGRRGPSSSSSRTGPAFRSPNLILTVKPVPESGNSPRPFRPAFPSASMLVFRSTCAVSRSVSRPRGGLSHCPRTAAMLTVEAQQLLAGRDPPARLRRVQPGQFEGGLRVSHRTMPSSSAGRSSNRPGAWYFGLCGRWAGRRAIERNELL